MSCICKIVYILVIVISFNRCVWFFYSSVFYFIKGLYVLFNLGVLFSGGFNFYIELESFKRFVFFILI